MTETIAGIQIPDSELARAAATLVREATNDSLAGDSLHLRTALLAATAVHAGFQLTVTALVYPALFRAPDWAAAHEAHRRGITPVVALVYAGLVAAAVLALVDGPPGPGTVVALAGVALSLGTTALVAAPLHGRLARSRDPRLVSRLRTADLVRTVGAFVALSGAVVAAL